MREIEIKFKESLKLMNKEQLEVVLRIYCNPHRHILTVKELGFRPPSKWIIEELFSRELENILIDGDQ